MLKHQLLGSRGLLDIGNTTGEEDDDDDDGQESSRIVYTTNVSGPERRSPLRKAWDRLLGYDVSRHLLSLAALHEVVVFSSMLERCLDHSTSFVTAPLEPVWIAIQEREECEYSSRAWESELRERI